MKTVLITGGSGLVGQRLRYMLHEKGYRVNVLSRSRKADLAGAAFHWDWKKSEIDEEAIRSADFIIHLAGANIGDKRWTAKRRELIIDSRVKTAELLFTKVMEQGSSVKAFISASAVGYYGSATSEKVFMEDDVPADDFLGKTCARWEQAADRFNESGIRTVKIRTGVVLTKNGGALGRVAMPVRLGIGSALGTGKQYMPWIHIDDLCSIYIMALENEQMEGVYNAVAPEQITNEEFTRELASVLNKPFLKLNVPSFALKLLFGKMSVIILEGSRVSSEKIERTDFRFQFPDLKSALTNLCKNDNQL